VQLHHVALPAAPLDALVLNLIFVVLLLLIASMILGGLGLIGVKGAALHPS